MSLAGTGYDTFRFWENAACNAVHIAAQFPSYIPNGFVQGNHILRFSSPDELMGAIDEVLSKNSCASQFVVEARHHLILELNLMLDISRHHQIILGGRNFHLSEKRFHPITDIVFFLDKHGTVFACAVIEVFPRTHKGLKFLGLPK